MIKNVNKNLELLINSHARSSQLQYIISVKSVVCLSGDIRGDLVRAQLPAQPHDPRPLVQGLARTRRHHDQDGPPPPLLQHRGCV